MDYRPKVVVLLLGTVALGQLNWYNLPALFPTMSSQLNLTIQQLGIISAAFVVGFGLVQVPAGVVSAKLGLRTTVLMGAVMISGFSVLTGLFSNPYQIAALRFAAGAGMALVYTPGMMLAVGYMKEGVQSSTIGLYSAIGDLGGLAGIFGWAVIGELVGWRLSLAVSGLAGLVFAGLLFVLLPAESTDAGFRIRTSDLRRVLLSRDILMIGAALLGLECGWNALVYFMVFYLETRLNVAANFAGFVGGLVLIGAILGALMVPALHKRFRRPRTLFLLVSIACLCSMVPISTGTIPGAVSGTFLEGLLNGAGFTLGVVMTRRYTMIPRYESLGVAWVSEIAIFGSSWATLFFTILAASAGYAIAWSASSLVGIIFVIPALLFLGKTEHPGPKHENSGTTPGG